MATENENKLDIKVSEEKDGSVIVDLPDNIQGPDSEDKDDEPQMADGGQADDDADHPDDTEAIRAVRRNRRRAKKEYIKQTNAEKDAKLTLLERQNRELMERLSVVERKTHSSDLARLDKAIEEEELRLQYAKMKLSEATNAGDGEAMTKAQEMWYDSRRKVESMRGFKEKAVSQTANEPLQQNPRVAQYANQWMEKNSWYDPSGSDEDSQIAKVIDNKLNAEGWDPATQDYWQELDRRLQKRISHRYTDDYDERPTRRPRSVVTSSGRESFSSNGARNTYVLTPEQVRAMKDAGFWDDAEKRNKMIKRYAQEARLNQGYRS
jgi:hypothetical protein